MAQLRTSTGGYAPAPPPQPHYQDFSRPSGPRPPTTNSTGLGDDADSLLAKVRAASSKMEDYIDSYSHPIRPYLPATGRFLIVVTFLEDALRILTQWSDQIYYLQTHRKIPWGISHSFLLLNVVAMLVCSFCVISKRFPEASIAGLIGVILAQGFGYGLIFDINFFLRNLSVMGGLLMVFSDSLASSSRTKKVFAGLPSLSENDRREYFQLAGRLLLIFLFFGFVLKGSFSVMRALVSVVGLGACVMVAVGFKAKWSALFLVTVLSVFNVFINNWWAVHKAHPQRDFLKYDFFQTLSIVGGFILLVLQGPGGISMDEKSKKAL